MFGLRFWIRLLKRFLLACVAMGALLLFSVVLVLRHYEQGLPETSELSHFKAPQVTRVLARDGTVLDELFTQRRTVVPFATIPPTVKLAILAAEDASFYEHAGLNYLGMLRAFVVNLRSQGAKQGGSTITQQVVKNVLLSPERTYERKIKELILARRIEQELTKDQILELYLNYIYFGHGRYGIEEASRYYFGKGVESISLSEAAMLAGLVRAPDLYSPRVDQAKATRAQRLVLDQMLAKGFASAEQIERAKGEPLVLAAKPETRNGLAPEVVEEARRVLKSVAGDKADLGGFTIETTLDPALQAQARAAIRRTLDDYEKRHRLLAPLAKSKREPKPFRGSLKASKTRVWNATVTEADDAKGLLFVQVGDETGTIDLRSAERYNPEHVPPSQFAEPGKVLRVGLVDGTDMTPGKPHKFRLELGPEGALVAIDVRSREILALVGSYEAVEAGFDRATFARRQPGSTFKPFVYATAIQARRLTPASILETDPLKLSGYKPVNFDESEGRTGKRLREAVANSINTAAAYTLSQVGASNVVALAQALGIESKLGTEPSLALGAYEVTPRELAAAYASLAAFGVYEKPILIKRIVGPDGQVLDVPERPPSRRVLDEASGYVLTSILTSVVKEGTAKRARSLGRPVAGKTGTSNDARDAWFAGYSTDIACVVWTGYDDPTSLGESEMGATVALPAWIDFMKAAHKGKPPLDFPVPAGVVRVKIDPETGLLPLPDQEGTLEEVFLAGTEPVEVAPDPSASASADEAQPPSAPPQKGSTGDAAENAPEDPPPF